MALTDILSIGTFTEATGVRARVGWSEQSVTEGLPDNLGRRDGWRSFPRMDATGAAVRSFSSASDPCLLHLTTHTHTQGVTDGAEK